MKSIDLSHDQHTQLRSQDTSSQHSSFNQSTVSSMPNPLAARLSFQTFTNFIPLPWASRGARTPPTLSSTGLSSATHSAASSASDDTVVLPRKSAGGFVSREKQLRKLRTRMEVEGVVAMKSRVQVQCKKCDGELVFI